MTISLRDVRAAFAQLKLVNERAGWDSSRLTLIEGSKTYGQLWQVVIVNPNHGGHTVFIRCGYTRREAFWALHAAADAMQAA